MEKHNHSSPKIFYIQATRQNVQDFVTEFKKLSSE